MKNMHLLLCWLPAMAMAQQDEIARIDRYMQSAQAINRYNGVVLVAKGGKVIYEKAFGYTDLSASQPLTTQTKFEIGTVTESFTAVAILKLAEEGKLRLTDSLGKYFQQFPYGKLTIHQVLTHTAGLPDFYELMKEKWGNERLAGYKDVVNSLRSSASPLLFTPGEKYDDDFTGYVLLAAILEKVTDKPYPVLMKEMLFDPLGLKQTRVVVGEHRQKKMLPRMAKGGVYDETKGQFLAADSFLVPPVVSADFYSITDGVPGSYGIVTTAGDLLRWQRMLKSGDLLSAASKEKMLDQHALKDTASRIYKGYGILTGTNEIGRFILLQDPGNATPGFHTSAIEYLDKDVSIITLTNRFRNSSLVNGTIAYILSGREVVPLYQHKAVDIDSSILRNYVGKYEIPAKIELLNMNGSLYLRERKQSGEPDLRLLAESTNKFFVEAPEYDTQIEFETLPDGRVSKAFLILRGLKKEIRRISE